MIFNIKTQLLNHVGGVVEALYRMNDEEITTARSNLPNNYLKILTKTYFQNSKQWGKYEKRFSRNKGTNK